MTQLNKKHTHHKSELYEEVVAANTIYAHTYVAQPDPFAHKRAVLLTCMDARLLTHNIMGFEAGDMYVIRNAGGRASDDAIRSLVIASALLKANQFFVVHHTDCGMQRFTDKSMNELLDSSAQSTAVLSYCSATLKRIDNNKNYTCAKMSDCCQDMSCVNYQCIDWLTIKNGLFKSVLEDVRRIRNHPLVALEIPIYGFIFDVMTGKLIPVSKAMKAGKPKSVCCK
jgi:carbonic anhydrase